MFEQKLIEEIIKAWELDQNHPRRGRKKRPIPLIRDVKEILEQSFLASLKREEEKPIAFCLAFLNRNDVENEIEQTGHKQLIVTFENQIPFTVEGISKIAPAFDPNISALIIDRDTDNDDQFFIWGAMFFGPSLNRFTEIPYSPSEHYFSRPDIFMVSTMSPGSIIISRGNSQIGSFSSGIFTRAIPTPFIERGLGRYLIRNIQGMEGFIHFGNFFWHVYSNALEYLLAQSYKRGHGSTIVFLPEGQLQEGIQQISVKYSFLEKLHIDELMYQILLNAKDFIKGISYKKILTERLDFLAQLSGIDGALVLKPNFNVLSFGSTLKPEVKWKGRVVIGPDGFGGGGDVLDLSKYGTRHNSAKDFAGSCPGCVVFVISQDGPIRAFVKNDQSTILCWPDCRASMFI